MESVFVLYTTVSFKESAQKIAHHVVKARLAACVQFFPIESVYE